jgi:hypothetical protein
VLFVANEQVPLRNSTNKNVLAKQTQATQKYCISTSLAILLRTQDINQIFTGQSEAKHEEEKDVSTRRQKG